MKGINLLRVIKDEGLNWFSQYGRPELNAITCFNNSLIDIEGKKVELTKDLAAATFIIIGSVDEIGYPRYGMTSNGFEIVGVNLK